MAGAGGPALGSRRVGVPGRRHPSTDGAAMKRKAWMAAAVAAWALGSGPYASAALLNGDPFGSVSATNAAYGPTAKANVLTALSAQRDNVTGAVSGTLTMTGTDTKARSIDATVDCLSIDLNDAGVLAHVTRAEN